jgi:hypothetical protein
MKLKALVTMDNKGNRKPFTIEFDSDTVEEGRHELYKLLDQGKFETDIEIEHISVVQEDRNFFL